MRKNYSLILRVVPLFCVVCLFFSLIAPVSAAEVFDYIDYSTVREYADGSKKITTTLDYTSLAADDLIVPFWGVFKGGSGVAFHSGYEFSFAFERNIEYFFKFYPTGSDLIWDLSTLTNDTALSFNLDIDFELLDSSAFVDTDYGFELIWYDENQNRVGSEYIIVGNGEFGPWQGFADLNIPSGVKYARFDSMWFSVRNTSSYAQVVSFYANKFEMMLFVPSVTDGKLDNVVGEQEKTNDLLDDMINSNPTPEKPDGSGKVDEMSDAEQNINDSVSGGYDEFGGVVDGAVENLIAYTNTFLAVSAIYGLFADISFIKTLLVISLAIGFVSFLLNLGIAHSSNKARESARAERKSQGHKGDT